MKKIFIRFFCTAVLFYVCVSLHAERKKSLVTEFFFELWRYEITGISEYPGIAGYSGINSMPAKIIMFPVWSYELRPKPLIDFLLPEYSGIIDSSMPYDPSADSGEWIDSVMREFPEGFIVTRPEELEQDPELSFISESEEPPVSTVERRLQNSEEMLSLYSYGDEYLTVQNYEGRNVIMNSDGKRIARRFFDDRMRLSRREIWEIGKNAVSAAPAVEENFNYNGEEPKPFSSVIYEKEKRRELLYDGKGRPVSCKIFGGENTLPDSFTSWKYNADGRIIEKYYEEYEYRNVKRKQIASIESKKDVYEYKIDGGSPDYLYYENGILRMQTIYSAEDSYITTLYFDGGFTVESYYEHNLRIRELFYKDGEIMRSRVYEN